MAAKLFIHSDWKRARGHGPQPFTVKPLHVNDMYQTFRTWFRLRRSALGNLSDHFGHL